MTLAKRIHVITTVGVKRTPKHDFIEKEWCKMIIDTHPHVISDDTEKYPISPLGGKRSKWSEKRGSNTVEKFIDSMKASGVDKAVLVHSSTTYGYDCSYVADCVARYPGILWGVGSIDFLADDAVEKLNYWAFERKLSAIRLFTHGSTQDKPVEFDDPKSFPAWEWCQKNRFPVVMQCRSDGFGMLHNVLNRFPNLLMALDHAGLPFGNLGDGAPYKELGPVLEFAKYPGVCLKVTSNLLKKYASAGKSTPQAFLREAINGFGADRIMWGSNFPSFGEDLQEGVQVILEACSELSAEEREACLGLNAQRFFSLTE